MEHLVVIARVITTPGFPCPGIGDAALGVTDTVLHVVYNTIACAGTVAPLWWVHRQRRTEADVA